MTMMVPSINLKAITSSSINPLRPMIATFARAHDSVDDSGRIRRRNIALGDSTRSQARLGMRKNLFSCGIGDAVPVLSNLSGDPFYDLQITPLLDGLVLEDCITGIPIAIVIRSSKYCFKIYSIQPSYSDQESVKLLDQDFYLYARVKRVNDVLQVVMAETDDEPKYTIHRVRDVKHRNRHFPVVHVIKDEDHGTIVASSRYGNGAYSYILAINGGVDTFLMILLAAIADAVN